MPNHVHNDLYISGPGAQVTELLIRIKAVGDEPQFDFGEIIPYPENFAEQDRRFETMTPEQRHRAIMAGEKDGFNSGGYEWKVANWGTKWGAYDVARRDYDGRICLSFQTAWSPPHPIILQQLQKAFPACSLTLEFFERGMEFCGGYSIVAEDEWPLDTPFQQGAIVSEWRSQYKGIRGG